jgi:hypothetical protein
MHIFADLDRQAQADVLRVIHGHSEPARHTQRR